LDGWSEYIKLDVWEGLLEKEKLLTKEILGSRDLEGELAWDCIDPGVSRNFLRQEYERSLNREFTSSCIKKCTRPCGVCNNEFDQIRIVDNVEKNIQFNEKYLIEKTQKSKKDPATRRILFSFSKEGRAIFIPHLSLLETFSMALMRAQIPALYTQGFNPLPKLDFAAPLALGISGAAEIGTLDIEFENFFEKSFEKNGTAFFIEHFNAVLPEGFCITRALEVVIPPGARKHSVSSLLWGFAYEGEGRLIPRNEDKAYRQGRAYGLRRSQVLARWRNDEPRDYFDVYKEIYTLS